MSETERLLGALGLCRRAGGLLAGFDAVCGAARQGKAALVLLAHDAAERTGRNVRLACRDRCDVAELTLSQAEIARIAGKRAAVLAVNTKELAALCKSAMRPCFVPKTDKQQF